MNADSLALVGLPDDLAFRLHEINFMPSGMGRELVVAFSKDFRDPALLRFLHEVRPVLFIGTFMSKLVLGPVQLRERSVCVACLHYWASTVNKPSAFAFESAVCVDALLKSAHEAISEFMNTGTIRRLERGFVAIDPQSGGRTLHPVVSLNDCRFCHRDSQIDLKAHRSPLTGLVSRLRRTSVPVAGVYHACGYFIDPPGGDSSCCNEAKLSWGKGLSSSQAEDACIGEAVEGYCLRHRGNEPVIHETISGIDGLDPREILLISGRQYQDRETINRRSSRYFIPEPFEPAKPVDWLPGTDLHDGSKLWAPAACCLTGYRFAHGEPQFCRADGSGCASGRFLTEAILAALYECIERDALAIWWYNRAARPKVPLDATGEEQLLFIENEFRRLGRSLTVLDITTDFNIPTYVAVTAELDGTQPAFGSASNISPRVALVRTLTESALNWFIASKNPTDVDIRNWLLTAKLQDNTHLVGRGTKYPGLEPAPMSPGVELELVVSRLTEKGLRPVMIDLSRPETLLTTVRVLAPGLRTFKPRYASGRLYDIPILLNWQSERLQESEMNPYCVF